MKKAVLFCLLFALTIQKISHMDEVQCSATDTRKDCGWNGISKSECKTRGCCWEESNESGVPWCFKPIRPKEGVCAISDSKKVDCGYYGIMAKECLVTNGCCWYPLKENSKEPWCYFSNAEPKCVVAPKDKKECGFYKITQEECEKRGCCYQPLEGNSKLPACYESTEGRDESLKYKEEETCVAKNSEKVDCGHYGISAEECEEKGCCYHESSTNGVPWCYKKVVREIVDDEPEEKKETAEAPVEEAPVEETPIEETFVPQDEGINLNPEQNTPVQGEETEGEGGTGTITIKPE